jgi:hypothetical protein
LSKVLKKIIINSAENEQLVERVESLFNSQFHSKKESKHAFNHIQESQEISNGIRYFQQEKVEQFYEIKTKIDHYFLALEAMGMSDKAMINRGWNVRFYLHFIQLFILLLFGFPIWLFGYINSFIPYKIPSYIALKITSRKASYGALILLIGTLSFTLCYGLIIFLVGQLSHSLTLTLSYSIALPSSGLFTIFYARIARRTYGNLKFYMKIFNKKRKMFQLITQRTDLINQLKALRNNCQKKIG